MPNPYYNHTSGVPAVQTRGSSPNMRAEFDSVATGFNGVYTEILALAAAVGIAVTVSEVPVASSATTDIGNGYGPVVKITGTNPITSFGANYKGAIFLRFADALLLTNSVSLVLPGGANITTVAGDACIAVPIGNPASGWRILAYCRMSQTLIDDVAVRTSSTYANPAWLTSLAWSKLTGVPTTLAGYGITDAPTKTGTGASGSWGIDITGWAKSAGSGADIASAATLPLAARTGNIVRVTGTTAVTATDLENGGLAYLYPTAALPLTYNATTMPLPGGISYTCSVGDVVVMSRDGNGALHVDIQPISGAPANKILTIPTPTFNAGAMTIPAASYALDFRSATLTSGAVTTVGATASALVVPSGATLGLTSAVQSDLYLLALFPSAGTIEYAIVNSSGGVDLSETGVISTTAISAGSTSASTVYSTTARTSVPYRVIGLLRSTQTTAGTWAQAMSLIQGFGGNALAAMSSLGYGQTLQNVTGSRAGATTYYNTTGKPISVSVYSIATTAGQYDLTINGLIVSSSAYNGTGGIICVSGAVPPGGSYSMSNVTNINKWVELR